MSKMRVGVIFLCLVLFTTMFSQGVLPGAARAADLPSPDLNGDRVVNMSDVILLASAFNSSRGSERYKAEYDLNNDGAINMNDVMLIARVFNTRLPSPTNTPTNKPTPTSTKKPTPTNVPPTPTPTVKPSPKFHCFLLLGQSNMNGYATAQQSDKVPNERILKLNYSTNDNGPWSWSVAVPPLNDAYLNPIGPGDWFAKTLIEKYPEEDTIGLIGCAVSGQSIDYFMNTKYNWIINRAKEAQKKGGTIDGILFHQGCSDNGNPAWTGKVKTFVSNIKRDLGLGDVPFLAGELLYGGGCAGHNQLVNQLDELIPNCYVVSAQGLVVDPNDTTAKGGWNLHFSHDSTVEFGKRYAAKMAEALGLN